MTSRGIHPVLITLIITFVGIIAAGCAGEAGSLDGFGGDFGPTPAPFNPNPVNPVNDEEQLQILGISPSSGPVGTVVTVIADGFDPDTDTITFGNLLEAASTEPIQIVVPAEASIGIYAIALHHDDITSNEVSFEVTEAPEETPDVEDGDDDLDGGTGSDGGSSDGTSVASNKATTCKKNPKLCKAKMKKKTVVGPKDPGDPRPGHGPDPSPIKKKHVTSATPDPAGDYKTDPQKAKKKTTSKKKAAAKKKVKTPKTH